MITTEQVLAAMQRWECAGLVPPVGLQQAPKRLLDSFIQRFPYMDEPTLEYVTAKVILGNEWPKYSTIEELAQEYEHKNSKFFVIDYFKEMRMKAFGEKESFQEFIQRIAEKHFPGRGQEWLDRHRFTLYFYGVCCDACSKCDGTCPRNGHRYHLRIKRGSSCPVPWGSLQLCEKYKSSITAEGKVTQKEQSLEEQVQAKEACVEATQPPDFNDLVGQEAVKPKRKVIQDSIF